MFKLIYTIMQLDVSFAKPVGPYRNPINHLPDKYCHVELSFHTTAKTFRRQLTKYIEGSHAPEDVQSLINRIRRINGEIIVCFFINWGDKVSCRYLSDLIDDAYLRPPESPVYDNIPIKISMDQSEKLVKYYIKNLGKSYDYARAMLSMCPFTLRRSDEDKFYCSQLVLYSLMNIGFEFDCNVDHVLPVDVYRLLEKHCIKDTDDDINGSSRTE